MNSDVSENVFLQTPKMQEFNRLFRQIAFAHQQIRNIYDAETLICEIVLGILTMSSYSQYDLNGKTVFNLRVHTKNENTTTVPICRPITLWCKNEDSRQISIPAELFDKDGAAGNQLAQQ